MRVSKRLTVFRMADKLCKFIPELDPVEVTACLIQYYGHYADVSRFHDWLRYFDSLVIDGKENSDDDIFSRFSAKP